MRGVAAGLLLASLVAMPLRAQAARPVRFEAWAPAVPVQWADTTPSGARLPPTRWKEGAALGGMIGFAVGVPLGLIAHGLCESDCGSAPLTALKGGIVAAALFAIPGAFIGGSMAAIPDSAGRGR